MAPALREANERNIDSVFNLQDKFLYSSKISAPDSRHWNVAGSQRALRSENPIRKIMDALKPVENPENFLISLGQGDPTVYGHLKSHSNLVNAVVETAEEGVANGYMHSFGHPEGRRAVADLYTKLFGRNVGADTEVILTSGCNHSLELCLQALCNPGDNVLIPKPGYPLYESFVNFLGGEVRYYSLLPENDWEIDLEHVERLVDERTKTMIVCNPGNPSGSVYSEKHLKEVLEKAHSLKIPIIADEVYSGTIFSGRYYVPMASLKPLVPIFTVSSLSKNFLVPGWRMGWIVVSDWGDLLKNGRLRIDPKAYKDLRNDEEWCSALLQEESVVVIPGTAFQLPNFIRCVFALPKETLAEAWDRIEAFCRRHSIEGH